jgi:hypothetical protein
MRSYRKTLIAGILSLLCLLSAGYIFSSLNPEQASRILTLTVWAAALDVCGVFLFVIYLHASRTSAAKPTNDLPQPVSAFSVWALFVWGTYCLCIVAVTAVQATLHGWRQDTFYDLAFGTIFASVILGLHWKLRKQRRSALAKRRAVMSE